MSIPRNKEGKILYDSEIFLLVNMAAGRDAILLVLARMCVVGKMGWKATLV